MDVSRTFNYSSVNFCSKRIDLYTHVTRSNTNTAIFELHNYKNVTKLQRFSFIRNSNIIIQQYTLYTIAAVDARHVASHLMM